jgi:hypothetical protein
MRRLVSILMLWACLWAAFLPCHAAHPRIAPPAYQRICLYAHANPVNGWDPSGHFFDTSSQLGTAKSQGLMAGTALPSVARAYQVGVTIRNWNRAVNGFQGAVRGSNAFKIGSISALLLAISGNLAMVLDALDDPYDGESIFYTVQSKEDAARLRGSGEPWPEEADRAHLGAGVYAWKYLEEAKNYLNSPALSEVDDLEILMFGIKNTELNAFSRFDVDSDQDPDAWLDRYSLLRGGNPDHGYEYVTRGTQIGVEHYFSKSVFYHLHFR